jgi:hypothetical protein
MTWVLIAIATYIVFYTFINLGYRKPDGAHEPWAEAQERKEEVSQKAMMDWIRIRVAIGADATPEASPDAVAAEREPPPERLDRALPIDLVVIMPGKPALAAGPKSVTAAAAASPDDPFRVHLVFAASDSASTLGEVLAYAKSMHLRLFLQDGSRTLPGLPPVPVAGSIRLELPPGTLESGDWQASLYCRDAVFTWAFRVE